ncbi:MAG: hypothetical protein EHM56_13560 [Chloroflexi bacterium]|nr:MAG: hypothetical protein EHM56_13560 [Chloroflexota bacterium]
MEKIPEYRLTKTQARLVGMLVREREQVMEAALQEIGEINQAIDELAADWAAKAGLPVLAEGQRLRVGQAYPGGPAVLRVVAAEPAPVAAPGEREAD